MESWFSLQLVVDPDAIEAIEFGLNELDALGTEINNLGKLPLPTITVVGYFHDKPSDEELKRQLNEALDVYNFDESAIKSMNWEQVEQQDWLAEWKKHWKPTVTDRFIIAPMWETVSDPDRIVIRIEPSMAFGTGTHETTRLCLRSIEREYRPEMSFLDVGTGTGILAIAAAKLQDPASPSAILGCDTDEDSIKIAIENAEVNETPGMRLYVGPIDGATPQFDFVCANLTADVIVPILPLLIEKAKQVLVLSGILGTQESEVLSALKNLGVTNGIVEADGEWISILIKR